ncbi:6-phosphofructokinase [Crenobacter sp. SG2305]|uniref:6-phosphofructokinase n=1 Tax=Crenobacter oryzisoli TaxID=3056844 RepID=UPI0025AB4A9F|nr:6-phosphofructokinase [Crenobacter sp. SG2305]MDN0085491.1 6-phosphofructokinase [Crenobacter sp. SG2305]
MTDDSRKLLIGRSKMDGLVSMAMMRWRTRVRHFHSVSGVAVPLVGTNMVASPLLYLQSGGPTAVLNASAFGVIETARRLGRPLLAARNGLAGLLDGRLVDTARVSKDDIALLPTMPGGSFGVSRHMIPAYYEAPQEWLAVRDVLERHNIHHLLLNGGNGSMGCAARLAEFEQHTGYPLSVIGIPKTIDNDLLGTDFSPGFPSAAKFLATSMREVVLDMNSMEQQRVFIMETMGRHTGWLAAATTAAARPPGDAPLLILLPEVPFDPAVFLPLLDQGLQRHGHCAIAVSEGLKGSDGLPVAESRHDVVYGHEQLGGAGAWLANLVRLQCGITAHVAQVDCLQRAARHLASNVDIHMAYEVGCTAVEWALNGMHGVMTGIVRQLSATRTWEVVPIALAEVGDLERQLPLEYIDVANLGVTPACLDYLRPLLAGEVSVPYGSDGLPDYHPIAWPDV